MLQGKLLYIGNKPSAQGGTLTTIESLSALLKQEGYRIETASHKKNKIFRLLHMLYCVCKHRNVVSKVLIDTYSTQNFYYAVYVAKLCRIFKIPYIPILHGGNLQERLKNSPMLSNKLFNNAAINVSPSLFLKEMFQKRGYNNVIFIPNSIELEKYPFLLRKAYPPKLLWVRSFSEIYNPMLALKVLKQLVENGIAASLCMIGPEKDGSLMKCKAFAEAENLPVIFTGKLTKEEWITRSKESTIFLNTTFYDNMPVSVIEAMALGLPVISTNVGGIPFLIQTKINGLLVPPDNTEAMISAITHLTTNPEDAMQIATNARKIVEDFDWINVKQKWMKVLNE